MNLDLHLLAADLDRKADTITSDVAGDLEPWAEDVARDGASRAPRRTGRLANSIESFTETRGRDVIAGARTDVDYAHFVHDGTAYVPPRPFLSDALRAASRSDAPILDRIADTASEI